MSEGSGGLAKRRRLLVLVAAGAVLLSGGGVAASFGIKSPAQAAADAEPPAPDTLTAPVERRVVVDTVVTRGTVTAEQSFEVAPTGSAAGGSRPVITKLPLAAGARVDSGQAVLEVAGRPVFALPGDVPVYRDLKPGATGEDVRQLQTGLRSLGFDPGGDPAGTYGGATKSAVRAFYAARGYEPLPASPDGQERTTAAEDGVTAAERAAADAGDALAAARSGQGAAAPGGGPAVEAARKQAARTAEDLARARRRLAEVVAANGPMVPSSELLFLSGFPARVDSVAGRVGGQVTGTVLTVSAGALVVKGELDGADKGLIRAGQQVEILSELAGRKAAGTVAGVSDTPGPATAGQSGAGGSGQQPASRAGSGGYQLLVKPDDPLDPGLAGQDVRITVRAAASSGPVLVVPLSAVSATADGRTVVTLLREGRRSQVEVTPGTVGGGSAEVRPLVPGSLAEGDRVVVGTRSAPGRTEAR
ncbi:peptidoglycan-binding protein [Kitasatospora terrestris]|uniref:peptidoglycan-binding protein n=1 Tax=Kitasatospora terrestris TaxID=258051 RepID=UPI0031EFF243